MNTEPSRRLLIYSPVPPIKSGTADYLDTLVRQLPALVRQAFAPVLVCEMRHLPSEVQAHNGIPIVDFRTTVARPEDVCLYFLANNEFHRYAFHALERHRVGLP